MFLNNPWANNSAPVPNTVNANCTGAPQSLKNTCVPFIGLPALRPDLRVGNVFNLTNDGIANYNGFTASLTQRATRGLTFNFNYTYSHTSDMVSNGGEGLRYSLNDSLRCLADPVCLSCNYSNSDYDVRHNISANYAWQLPFKFSNKMVETLAGGWQISGTFYGRAGLPFSGTDGLVPGQANSIRNSVNGTFLATPTGIVPKNCNTAAFDTYSAGNTHPCLLPSMFSVQEVKPSS